MKHNIKLFSTCITVLLIVVACGNNILNERDTDLISQNAVEELYSDNLMRFHIEHQMTNALFVLTAYKRPYYGHFEYIFLTPSNELWVALDYSSTHIVGGRHGNITADEKEKILDILSNLSRADNKIIPADKTLITISHGAEGGADVFSCQDSSCPSDICKIYEIANAVSKRSDSTNFAQFSCPINAVDK